MIDVASDILEELEQSSGMLPRRWYTDEIAPPLEHQVRLSSQTWRYRIITRRQHEDATPIVGVASSFVAMRSLRQSGTNFFCVRFRA